MPTTAQSRKLYFLLLGIASASTPAIASAGTLTYSANPPAVHAGAWQAATGQQPGSTGTQPSVVLQMAAYDYPKQNGRLVLTRPVTTAVDGFGLPESVAAAPSTAAPTYGLQLPEPGTGSTLIATIALAAFFFVRRSIS